MSLTITFRAGASKALQMAADHLDITVDEYVRRAALDKACQDLFGEDAANEPEIAEMFLREGKSEL